VPDSASESLCTTIGRLMSAHSDNQTSLALAIGLTQGQVSRKQAGKTVWTVPDVEKVAAHYLLTIPELFSGANAAVKKSLERAHQDCPNHGRDTIYRDCSG